ncbi:MAG: hypothetical protein AB8B80_08675 [Marinicellaceae bacterium]
MIKRQISKKNIPLIFLVCASFFWTYFYTSNNWLNQYGASKFEWLLFIDIFVTVPLVCYLCFKDHLKQAIIKSLIYMGLLVLLGSYIIPNELKHYWLYLEYSRYLLIGLVIVFELFIISSVLFSIKSAFNKNQDPDLVISTPVEKYFGQSVASEFIKFDFRLWTFALFPKKIQTENYIGNKHFHCHLKDGTQSFLQGFVFLTIFEIPILHVFLHLTWSPLAANIITAITIFSFAYLIAQYRAIEKRPVSITQDHLIIRYALSNPVFIQLSDIRKVEFNEQTIARNKHVKRYNLLGVPNVKIGVKNSNKYKFHTVYLGVNLPAQLIKSIEHSIKE